MDWTPEQIKADPAGAWTAVGMQEPRLGRYSAEKIQQATDRARRERLDGQLRHDLHHNALYFLVRLTQGETASSVARELDLPPTTFYRTTWHSIRSLRALCKVHDLAAEVGEPQRLAKRRRSHEQINGAPYALDEVVRMVREGKTLDEVAYHYTRTDRSLKNWLARDPARKAAVQQARRVWREEQMRRKEERAAHVQRAPYEIAEVTRLLREGKTLKEVATHYERSLPALLRWIRTDAERDTLVELARQKGRKWRHRSPRRINREFCEMLEVDPHKVRASADVPGKSATRLDRDRTRREFEQMLEL